MGTIYGETTPISSISLARYAKLIGYTDCAFFGVMHPNNAKYSCREVWTQSQRDDILMYLAEAEEEITQMVGYPLTPRWIAGERHPYRNPVIADYSHLLEVGIKSSTVIELDSVLSFISDPATLTIASTVTDYANIHIFYPDTDVEIVPSNIYTVGADLIIEIPWCRLVAYDQRDNPEYGLDYEDPLIYQDKLDVFLWSTDASTQAELVWPHACNSLCSSSNCTEYTLTGCEYMALPEIGKLNIGRGVYSNGAWVSTIAKPGCCYGQPEYLKLNYKAGLTKLSLQAESAILRLAHSKMPTEPCGCDVVQRLWKRDRNVPDLMTRERLECPFGLSDGAWVAWKFSSSLTNLRATVL